MTAFPPPSKMAAETNGAAADANASKTEEKPRSTAEADITKYKVRFRFRDEMARRRGGKLSRGGRARRRWVAHPSVVSLVESSFDMLHIS